MATISKLTGEDVSSRYSALGEGKPGIVFTEYEGHDALLKRRVSICVLNPLLATKAVMDVLSRDMVRSAGLNHPGLERIVDVVDVRSTLGMIVEERHGANLRLRLEKMGSFPAAFALDTLIACAEAVQAMHREGVVHGGIDLSTVWMTPDGMVKLTQAGRTSALAGLPSSARPPGMPGVSHSSVATDLRGLGALLYCLLSGKNSPGAGVPHLQPQVGIPPALCNLVEGLCAGTPRYHSVEDALVDLRGIRDALRFGRPIPDIPASDRRRLKPATQSQALPASRKTVEPVPDQYGVRRYPWSAEGNRGARSRPFVSAATNRDRDEDHPPVGGGIRLLHAIGVMIMLAILIPFVILTGFFYLNWRAMTPEVVVPSLRGDTEAQAQQILDGLGLKVSVDPSVSFDDGLEPGQVARQYPLAGQHTKPPRTIDLFLSAGSRYVKVPEVEGSAPEDAILMMQQAGLPCSNNGDMSSDTTPFGMVVRQYPAAGAQVLRGTKSSIRVSSGPSLEDLSMGGSSYPEQRTVTLSIPSAQQFPGVGPVDPSGYRTVEIREADITGYEKSLWTGKVKPGDKFSQDVTLDPYNTLRVYMDGQLLKVREAPATEPTPLPVPKYVWHRRTVKSPPLQSGKLSKQIAPRVTGPQAPQVHAGNGAQAPVAIH